MKLQLEIIEEAIELIRQHPKDKGVIKEQCKIIKRIVKEINNNQV